MLYYNDSPSLYGVDVISVGTMNNWCGVQLLVFALTTACSEPKDSDSTVDTGNPTDSAVDVDTNDVDDSGDLPDSGDTSDTAVDTGEDFVYQQPDSSICDATLDLESGFLCAIRPSRLDSDVLVSWFDQPPPNHPNTNQQFVRLGWTERYQEHRMAPRVNRCDHCSNTW